MNRNERNSTGAKFTPVAIALVVALVLSLSGHQIMMASNEPVTEVFDIGTAWPLQGTNWHFDAGTTHYDYNQQRGYVNVPTLFVGDGANLTITGTSGVEQNRRVVVSGTATIVLDDASITMTGDAIRISPGTTPATYVPVSPMKLTEGANLTLTLVGDNTLAMATGPGNRWSAGLGVPFGSSLTIEGDGSLTAVSGLNAAAIGGHEGTHLQPRISGTITINSGTINATAHGAGAAIGGGSLLHTGRITINGGDITATNPTASIGGTGIGGGNGAQAPPHNNDNVITITGGTVTAMGGPASAGIGGGNNSPNGAGTINISGGTVTAVGGSSVIWGGAGIGGGFGGHGGNINITGGIISATGGGVPNMTSGTGIGGGSLGHSGNIDITGGLISATGGPGAANIGGSAAGGHVTIGDGALVIDAAHPVTDLAHISNQPQDATVIHGSITQNLYVGVSSITPLTPSFRWYTNSTLVGTSSTLALPPDLSIGTHYFFAQVSFVGINGAYLHSQAARVEVLPQPLRGDVNGDGIVNAADSTLLRRLLAAEDRDAFIAANPHINFNMLNADVDGNGTIDIDDLILLRQYLAAADPFELQLVGNANQLKLELGIQHE